MLGRFMQDLLYRICYIGFIFVNLYIAVFDMELFVGTHIGNYNKIYMRKHHTNSIQTISSKL